MQRFVVVISALCAFGQTSGCTSMSRSQGGEPVGPSVGAADATDAGRSRVEGSPAAGVEGDADASAAETRRARKIAALERGIEADLQAIAEQRATGKFTLARYQAKRLAGRITELQALAPQHSALASAPARLHALEKTHAEGGYQRQVVTDKCAHPLAKAEDNSEQAHWQKVDRNLLDYVACRAEMVRAGVPGAAIEKHDARAVAIYDAFAKHQLGRIEAHRKAGEYRYARSFETGLESHLAHYRALAPKSPTPAAHASAMAALQKAHRDPQEVAIEQARSEFDAWKAQVTDLFRADWTRVQAAEAAARALLDEGRAAAATGDGARALASLQAAREALYRAAYPTVATLHEAYLRGDLERGLSYEIALARARIHAARGAAPALYAELSLVERGRPWTSEAEELHVRLHDLLADETGTLAPLPTDAARRYAARPAGVGHGIKAAWRVAEAGRGQAFRAFGLTVAPISHRSLALDAADSRGKIAFVEAPVTRVVGDDLRFDFRTGYRVPTKCWRTDEIASYSVYTGRVTYHEKCQYKKVEDGYSLVVGKPADVPVAKGDTVSFFAVVGSKQGDFDVRLLQPAFVRIASKGQTRWLLGSAAK